jgi:acetaldehyde dehydrogenase
MGASKVAIIGSGNIGTDLLIKIKRLSEMLDVSVMVGVDADSDGLARARRLGVATTAEGVQGLLRMDEAADLCVVFDATSASAHVHNDAALQHLPIRMIDLTPAAIGPFVVPAVNLSSVAKARNVNMVTCGGQATIPIVAAISREAPVRYAEIVASIASRSAGPGTRANIDEFTETTAQAIEVVGGAERGKAIIILNPAEPPMVMRDTVIALAATTEPNGIHASVLDMVSTVAAYVPGYRLKHDVRVQHVPATDPRRRLIDGSFSEEPLWEVTVFLEIEGAGHYLPSYAGNLDIMTSAAVRVGEVFAEHAVMTAAS